MPGACARLSGDTDASGLMCWMSVDGGLDTRWLTIDVVALAATVLVALGRQVAISRAAQRESAHGDPSSPARAGVLFIARAAPPMAPWVESARRWVLRTSHLVVLVLVLGATCTANVSSSHGLLALGFGAFL